MSQNELERAPKGGLKQLKKFLHDAFILPMKDPKRAYIYLTALLFAFGFAFLDMFLLLDIAAMRMEDMLTYLVAKFTLITVMVSVTLYAISRLGGRTVYPFLLGTMALSLTYCLVFKDTLSPLEIGILYALLTGPFWGLFHVIFAISATESNLGNEVSLAGTGMTVGMTIGMLAGGFAKELTDSPYVIAVGFACTFAATVSLVIFTHKHRLKASLEEGNALEETLPEALVRCRFRSIGSVFEGFFNMAAGNLWVVFMSLSGIAAAAVGIWNALMVLTKIVVTPLAGTLVNHGMRREMVLGSAINAAGWLPLLLTNAFIIPSMYIWSVGTQLYATGLSSAWYASRTVASLIVREIILGICRVAFLFMLVPLLYTDSYYFVVCSAVAGVLMAIYAWRWMLHIKVSGPVMAIENKILR